MFFPPQLYFQLYSVWLLAESQRLVLALVHEALDRPPGAMPAAAELGARAFPALPAPAGRFELEDARL